MLFLILFFSFLLCTVRGGELLIAKVPSSITLLDDGIVDQSSLPEIFSAALGFTTQEEVDWKGMKIVDPFHFAKTLVVLNVNGIDSMGMLNNIKKYELNNDEGSQMTWIRIKNKVNDRYPLENLTMQYLNFPPMPYISDVKNEEVKFLNEISDKYIKQAEKSNEVPNLYWYNLDGSNAAIGDREFYDSAAKDMKDLVLKALMTLSDKFSSDSEDSAMVVAIINDSHARKSRSVSNEKADEGNAPKDPRSNVYDPDFPVIFNIILWFSIALVFSLLAVSVFIATMDPGRDSIIYRMTSNRMKKDS